MKKDLSVLYMVREVLNHVKEEMDKKNMSFDEFLKYWDETIEKLEKEALVC